MIGRYMMKKDDTVISLRSVYAGYDEETILEDVNFEMLQGDFVGMIGPNGGGKTTLLKVILGLIKPNKGEVKVMGESAQAGRRHIGYVPQSQVDDMSFPVSVWEVVRMGRISHPAIFRRLTPEDDAIVAEKLDWLGLQDIRKRSISEISGGQRQRVFIARALAAEPQLLLLDEPTASVDVTASQNLFELLAKINQQVTILLISHDITAISRYVKTIGCVNRQVIYHREKQLSVEMLTKSYGCPVDLIAHGVPHRVLDEHHMGEHHD